jgi:hypothetical protein
VVVKKKNESVWTKMYIMLLFFFGIGIWIAIQPVQSHKLSIDPVLNKRIVDVLITNDTVQDDVLQQCIVTKNKKTKQWNKFYETIKLKFWNNLRFLNVGFKNIADRFYSKNKSYSNITFISKNS